MLLIDSILNVKVTLKTSVDENVGTVFMQYDVRVPRQADADGSDGT